ncbi:Nif3-like dinuclear metal center hexameric protein [Novosphingobium sp.]|uniref:Nif3-like dinuclear metal center hexameric protein n=1 Tax=Novosphingobium sp. TaxID=1874826 RepID=UPI00286E78B8|nr:Nif3-like dinuclear metal center hexameric protein [Novosphingobium sp.]
MIDRRTTLAALAATIVAPAPLALAGTAPTAREVFAAIKDASGQPWDPNPTDDRIIYGPRDVPVTGIATCFTASVDVLRRAKAAGLNYIVPHEASFYERYDDFAESAVRDDDPVLLAKKRFLDANGMVIQRMHGHAHSRPGDAIMTGLIRRLGWEAQREARAGMPMPWIVMPATNAGTLGRHIATRLGRRTLRMFGDPARTIRTVSVSAGMPGENAQIQQLESGADAVLLGEVREPEVLGYAQDMAASRPVTIYLAGHTGEDPGMGVLADWLRTVFPALPVQWLEAADPYSNPA